MTVRTEDCKPPSWLVTAPNRLPAIALFVMSVESAAVGAYCMRRRVPEPQLA